jgi:photosystem II stability/assembly factor-like uncharacterized protein
MIDAAHLVVIGPAAGQVRHSADGGVTWQVSPMVGFGPALGVHFWDPDHGVAIVQVSNDAAPAAAMMTTSDGGQTWIPVTIPGG